MYTGMCMVFYSNDFKNTYLLICLLSTKERKIPDSGYFNQYSGPIFQFADLFHLILAQV